MNKTEVHCSRHCAEDLLDAGLKLLESESVQQLTIENLCRKLKVTKGSFYHHFNNRADYLERMLEHWVEVWTVSLMKEFGTGGSAQDRYERMVNEAVHYPMNVEISIRAWAQRDQLAQKYLQQVDSMRIKYLQEIFTEMCGDSRRAEMLARIDYMLFVGSRMISPPIMGDEVHEIISMLQNELYGIPQK